MIGSREYKMVDNIISVNKDSEIYLLQEIPDERYELLFGDGIIGKKLSNGDIIKVSYITTDGETGNGPSVFAYAGTIVDSSGVLITPNRELPLQPPQVPLEAATSNLLSLLSTMHLECILHSIVPLQQGL